MIPHMSNRIRGVDAVRDAWRRAVPPDRLRELRRRLTICLVAYLVALILAIFPIPFVTNTSITQAVIEFLSRPPSPGHLQYVGHLSAEWGTLGR
jgi:hypothetical protein